MRTELSDEAKRRVAEILASLPPLTEEGEHRAAAIFATARPRTNREAA